MDTITYTNAAARIHEATGYAVSREVLESWTGGQTPVVPLRDPATGLTEEDLPALVAVARRRAAGRSLQQVRQELAFEAGWREGGDDVMRTLTMAQRVAMEQREAERYLAENVRLGIDTVRDPRNAALGARVHGTEDFSPWAELRALLDERGADPQDIMKSLAHAAEILDGDPGLAARLAQAGKPKTSFASDALFSRALLHHIARPDASGVAVRSILRGDPRLAEAYARERRGNTRERAAWLRECTARRGRQQGLREATEAKEREGMVVARKVASLVRTAKRADPSLSAAAAHRLVYGENPTLFSEWRKERRAAAGSRREVKE